MTTCIHCGMNYIAEHVCTSGGPVRVIVQDPRDAEIAKLREEVQELTGEIEAGAAQAVEWSRVKAEAEVGKGWLIEMAGKSYLFELIGELAKATFMTQGAENAIGCEMSWRSENGGTIGPFEITVRRLHGKHPLVLLAAEKAETFKLREELAEARKVMEELVALSDMKRKVCAEHGWPDHDVRADYKRRISAAWEQARAFLARKEAK